MMEDPQPYVIDAVGLFHALLRSPVIPESVIAPFLYREDDDVDALRLIVDDLQSNYLSSMPFFVSIQVPGTPDGSGGRFVVLGSTSAYYGVEEQKPSQIPDAAEEPQTPGRLTCELFLSQSSPLLQSFLWRIIHYLSVRIPQPVTRLDELLLPSILTPEVADGAMLNTMEGRRIPAGQARPLLYQLAQQGYIHLFERGGAQYVGFGPLAMAEFRPLILDVARSNGIETRCPLCHDDVIVGMACAACRTPVHLKCCASIKTGDGKCFNCFQEFF